MDLLLLTQNKMKKEKRENANINGSWSKITTAKKLCQIKLRDRLLGEEQFIKACIKLQVCGTTKWRKLK